MNSIKDKLPKTEITGISNCCYIDLNLYNKNPKIERIELDYKPYFMKNPEEIFNLRKTFEEFYDIKESEKDKRTYSTNYQEELIINFVKENNDFITLGIDNEKDYLYFIYRKSDQKSKDLVTEFVCMMIDN
jgi:hypothetical protein